MPALQIRSRCFLVRPRQILAPVLAPPQLPLLHPGRTLLQVRSVRIPAPVLPDFQTRPVQLLQRLQRVLPALQNRHQNQILILILVGGHQVGEDLGLRVLVLGFRV